MMASVAAGASSSPSSHIAVEIATDEHRPRPRPERVGDGDAVSLTAPRRPSSAAGVHRDRRTWAQSSGAGAGHRRHARRGGCQRRAAMSRARPRPAARPRAAVQSRLGPEDAAALASPRRDLLRCRRGRGRGRAGGSGHGIRTGAASPPGRFRSSFTLILGLDRSAVEALVTRVGSDSPPTGSSARIDGSPSASAVDRTASGCRWATYAAFSGR